MDNALLDRISTLLRRDLKLGPAATIDERTALVGGDMDLDSIDILLVLTSLEKEFGLQLTSDKVSKSAFQTVGTLVDFVEKSQRNGQIGALHPAVPSPAHDWLAHLPHGPAFRFITGVRSVEPARRADGTWQVRGDEPFLAAHFPGRPIVPGVLIVEALAQLAGITASAGSQVGKQPTHGGRLAHADMRFLQPVKPPAEIALRVTLKNALQNLHQFDAAAEVAGICVAAGTVTIHLDAT